MPLCKHYDGLHDLILLMTTVVCPSSAHISQTLWTYIRQLLDRSSLVGVHSVFFHMKVGSYVHLRVAAEEAAGMAQGILLKYV